MRAYCSFKLFYHCWNGGRAFYDKMAALQTSQRSSSSVSQDDDARTKGGTQASLTTMWGRSRNATLNRDDVQKVPCPICQEFVEPARMSVHIDVCHPEPPTKRARLLGSRPAKEPQPQLEPERVTIDTPGGPSNVHGEKLTLLQPTSAAGVVQRPGGLPGIPETEGANDLRSPLEQTLASSDCVLSGLRHIGSGERLDAAQVAVFAKAQKEAIDALCSLMCPLQADPKLPTCLTSAPSELCPGIQGQPNTEGDVHAAALPMAWSDADWTNFLQGLSLGPQRLTSSQATSWHPTHPTHGPYGRPCGPSTPSTPFPRLPPRSRPLPHAPSAHVATKTCAAQPNPTSVYAAPHVIRQEGEASGEHRQQQQTSSKKGRFPCTAQHDAQLSEASLSGSTLIGAGPSKARDTMQCSDRNCGGQGLDGRRSAPVNTCEDAAGLSGLSRIEDAAKQSAGIGADSHPPASRESGGRFNMADLPESNEAAAWIAPSRNGNHSHGDPYSKTHEDATAQVAHAQSLHGLAGRQEPGTDAPRPPFSDADNFCGDSRMIRPPAEQHVPLPAGATPRDERMLPMPGARTAPANGQSRGTALGGVSRGRGRRGEPPDPVRARWASKAAPTNTALAPAHPPLPSASVRNKASGHGTRPSGQAAGGTPGRGTKRSAEPSRGRGRPRKGVTDQRPGVSTSGGPFSPSGGLPVNPAGVSSAQGSQGLHLAQRQRTITTGLDLEAGLGKQGQERFHTNGSERSGADGRTEPGAVRQHPPHAADGGTAPMGGSMTERPALQACPICGVAFLVMDNAVINQHVDECLNKSMLELGEW